MNVALAAKGFMRNTERGCIASLAMTICISAYLHIIYTTCPPICISAYLHICTSTHLHICTSAYLHI